jgi:peptidoglycan/LPS O-acetylase OafA/YrhL
MLKMILLMTRGILINPRSRRSAMFMLLLAALAMVFAGATFLAGSIATPWTFIVYWGICGWLTFAALLLALWDMLMIRVEARRTRRELERRMKGHPPDEQI